MSTLSPVILFEDEYIFVVHKPHGVHSVHIEGGGPSLADWLLIQWPSLYNVADRSGDAGLVQRLDLDTSGILLGAKTPAVWQMLRLAVQSGEIKKEYVALVEGIVSFPLTIESYIGNAHRGSKKVRVYEKEPRGNVRVLSGATTLSPIRSTNLDHSLLRIHASPARRHQVRAHCAHVGHPLVGDALYGSSVSFRDTYDPSREFFLHSHTVTLVHPITKQQQVYTAPYEEPLARS